MKRLLFALILLPALCLGQTAYTIYTDLEWDEGFGLRISNGTDSGTGTGGVSSWTDGTKTWTTNQWAGGWLTVSSVNYPISTNTATVLTVTGTPPAGPVAYTLKGGWRGWNILGVTDIPYEFVDEYPEDDSDYEVKRIILDLQDVRSIYPKVYADYSDTGRICRMQIQDGGTEFDLTSWTVTVKSWASDDNAVIRNEVDITTSVSYAEGGWIEWKLGAADLAEDNYFRLKLVNGTSTLYVPTDTYVYIDMQDQTRLEYTSAQIAPDIKIRSGGWIGKTVRFTFKDINRDTIDLSGVTVQMNTSAMKVAGSFISASSCTTSGTCSFTITAGKFNSADIYNIYFKLTSPSGEILYVPSRGAILLEAI